MFPNVLAAGHSQQREALNARYRAAIDDAERRGTRTVVEQFETAVQESKVVISRSLPDVQRLAGSDHELYSTFYQLVGAGVRLPEGNKWDRLRPVVDSILFPFYKDEIRFGALSLSGRGIAHFGSCSMVVRTEFVDFRTSCFEENSIVFMERTGATVSAAADCLPGFRSVWADRGKHAAAKLAGRIESDSQPSDFPKLLVKEGSLPETDDFIEAHIYGPMTIRTFESVCISGSLTRAERASLRGLSELLSARSVRLETR